MGFVGNAIEIVLFFQPSECTIVHYITLHYYGNMTHLQLLPIVHSPVDGLVGEQVAEELAVDRLVGRRRPVEVQRGRQRRDLRFQERRRRGWF